MQENQGLTGSARKQLLTFPKQMLPVCLLPRAAARACQNQNQNQNQVRLRGQAPLQPPKIPP
jgi:hypothetical protein